MWNINQKLGYIYYLIKSHYDLPSTILLIKWKLGNFDIVGMYEVLIK